MHRVDWDKNSIYSPPNAYFRQRLSSGPGPAQHIAVYGDMLSLGVHGINGENEWKGMLSFRDGGTLIE